MNPETKQAIKGLENVISESKRVESEYFKLKAVNEKSENPQNLEFLKSFYEAD